MKMNLFVFTVGLMASQLASAKQKITYSCPAETLTIYECNADTSTAKTDEVRNSMQKMKVCYSSVTKKFSAVLSDVKSSVSVVYELEKNTTPKKIEVAFTEKEKGDMAVAGIELDRKSLTGKYTFLLPGNDMQVSCVRTRDFMPSF